VGSTHLSRLPFYAITARLLHTERNGAERRKDVVSVAKGGSGYGPNEMTAKKSYVSSNIIRSTVPYLAWTKYL
jgi:hypothetical protein